MQMESLVRARNWIREHMIRALAIAFILGLLIGLAPQSGSSTSELEARLASLQDETSAEALSANEQISSLEDAKSSLEGKVNDLNVENSDLAEEITKLNAKRALPSLIGLDQDRAFSLEDKFGWELRVERRFSDAPTGSVIEQSPAEGTMMRYGAPFSVVLAKSIPQIPGLSGLRKSAAADRVRNGGWNVAFVEQISDGAPGRVIGISPSVGSSLLPGQTVTLTISKKAPPPAPEPVIDEPEESTSGGCTPGYSPCLPPASDYDCAGGSGDGPEYTGYVSVTGSDPYGLDSDNDGAGCES